MLRASPAIFAFALLVAGAARSQAETDLRLRDLIIMSLDRNDIQGVQRALDQGFPVDSELDGSRATALMWARRNDIVAFLLRSGASPHATDSYGQNALAHAAGRGDVESVDLLLAARADVNARGPRTCGALCSAVENRPNLDVIRRLIAAGADVNAADCWNRSALTRAAGRGNLELALPLLANRAEVDRYETGNGDTIVMLAAGAGGRDLVARLVEAGASLEWRNPLSCDSALHRAAERGQLSVVEWLAQRGVDLDATNGLGLTALALAERRSHQGVVAFLRGKGAKSSGPPTQGCVGPGATPNAYAAWQKARERGAACRTDGFPQAPRGR